MASAAVEEVSSVHATGAGAVPVLSEPELAILTMGWSKPLTARPGPRRAVARALAAGQRARLRSPEKPPPLPAGSSPQVQRGLALGRVPAHYRAVRWERCPERDKLSRWCAALPARLEAGGGINMSGAPSRGKSGSAALVAMRAVQHGHTVRWAYVPDLLDTLRCSRTDPRRLAELDAQINADLVVWDDFGVTAMVDWDIGLLDWITERRYAARRSMIVTTNLLRKTLEQDERMARLMARWNDRNRWLYFTGPDLRARDGSNGMPQQEVLELTDLQVQT